METKAQSQGVIATLNITGIAGTAPTNISPITSPTGITFYGADSIIYGIIIGGIKYGSTNGSVQGTATIPADGVFTLYSLEGVVNGPLHYMTANIGGTYIQVGSHADGNVIFDATPTGMQVSFNGIYSTTNQINGILFNLVSNS